MKKFTTMAATSLIMIASSTSSLAEGWTFPGYKKDGYTIEPTLSVVTGTLSPAESGSETGTITGLELSINCPILQSPTNRVRQQISFVQYDEVGLTINSLELNPHYLVEVADNLELGFGPGFGVMSVESGAVSKTLLGLQLGGSAHYRIGALFLGGEARYQLTSQQDFGLGKAGVDNTRLLVKIGMDF